MMKFAKRFWFVGLMIVMALAACGAASSQEAVRYTQEEVAMAPQQDFGAGDVGRSAALAESDGFAPPAAIQATSQPPSPSEPAQQERIILRDASLAIVVESTTTTIDAISRMADEMGGWVVSADSSTSSYSQDRQVTNGTVSVRVPAAQLDSALGNIREMALEVERESVTGRDVTDEYVDLSSRLGNLEATEEQLAEIMDTAFSVEDVLNVQRELTQVRGQIETIEGRLRYFDEASAYSSISVTVTEQLPQIGNVQVAGWNPLNTAADAFGALVVAGQWAVDSAITLVILGLPTLAILAALVWVLRRAWRAVRGGRRGGTVVTTEAQ